MKGPQKIDLNADMGERYGTWTKGNDLLLLDYVSSANIACGFHAGDPHTMRETVAAAHQRGVAIGAHPGFPDLQGFGRRDMHMTPQEVYEMVIYQVGALDGFARAVGSRLRHVKPHGALYNRAAVDPEWADALAAAVYDLNPALVLYGLSGSALIGAGEKRGLAVAHEVFADRTYESDGTLTPRHVEGSLITDQAQAVAQILGLLHSGQIRSRQGTEIALRADTVCIHGDGPDAVAFAKALHEAVQRENIQITNNA